MHQEEFCAESRSLKHRVPLVPQRLDSINREELFQTISRRDSNGDIDNTLAERVRSLQDMYLSKPSTSTLCLRPSTAVTPKSATSSANPVSRSSTRLDPSVYPRTRSSIFDIAQCRSASPGCRLYVDSSLLLSQNKKSRWNSKGSRLPPPERPRSPGPIYYPKYPPSQSALGTIRIGTSHRQKHNGILDFNASTTGSEDTGEAYKLLSTRFNASVSPLRPVSTRVFRAASITSNRASKNPYTVTYV